MKANKIEKAILVKAENLVEMQIRNSSSKGVIIRIINEEYEQLNIKKEELALKIRDHIMTKYSSKLRFVEFDDNWTLYFCSIEFEDMKNEAIRYLLNGNDLDSYYYIRKFNFLLVSEGGLIIGEISNVTDREIPNAVKIVRYLSIRFDKIIDDYHEAWRFVYGDRCFLNKTSYIKYKELLAYV